MYMDSQPFNWLAANKYINHYYGSDGLLRQMETKNIRDQSSYLFLRNSPFPAHTAFLLRVTNSKALLFA